MSILKYWRELLILLLICIIYVIGKTRVAPETCTPEIKVEEKVVFRDRVIYKDKVIYRDRVITKPDGTRIEERTRTEDKTKIDDKTRKEDKRIVITKPDLVRKHVSVSMDPLAKLRDNQYVAIFGGGLRLANTPLFLTINPSINLSKPRLENIFIGITWEIK